MPIGWRDWPIPVPRTCDPRPHWTLNGRRRLKIDSGRPTPGCPKGGLHFRYLVHLILRQPMTRYSERRWWLRWLRQCFWLRWPRQCWGRLELLPWFLQRSSALLGAFLGSCRRLRQCRTTVVVLFPNDGDLWRCLFCVRFVLARHFNRQPEQPHLFSNHVSLPSTMITIIVITTTIIIIITLHGVQSRWRNRLIGCRMFFVDECLQ